LPVFEVNLQDYLNFRRGLKKAPKLYSKAGAHVLNSAAFGTRKLAIRNIKKSMIARNERFIAGSVRVRKAALGRPLAVNQSQVGSVKRDRFSGWREQEGGQQTKREHYATEDARKGNRRKQIIKIVRLANGGRFPHPKDFKGQSPIDRARNMIRILSRSGFTKPFVIVGLEKTASRTPPGLYRFGGGRHPNKRINLMQRFKTPERTKRDPWLQPAMRQYISKVNLRTVWGRALTRELRKAGVRGV
jgi:hypothetical protein